MTTMVVAAAHASPSGSKSRNTSPPEADSLAYRVLDAATSAIDIIDLFAYKSLRARLDS